MNEKTLRNTIGVFILLTHFGLLLLVVGLTVVDKFSRREMFTTIGIMLPLFATYATIIVKEFLAAPNSSARSPQATSQRIFVSFLIPVLAASMLLTAIFWKSFGSLGFDDFTGLVAVTETAFGVYIGYVVKSLFNTER